MKYKLLIILLIFSLPARAEFVQLTAKVFNLGLITPQYANVRISVNIDISNHPCATENNLFSFDLTTEQGKLMYSTLLTAKSLDVPVIFRIDSEFCGLWGKQALVTSVIL